MSKNDWAVTTILHHLELSLLPEGEAFDVGDRALVIKSGTFDN